MSLNSLIKNSSAVRIFSAKKIPAETIERIIDAGMWGPSLLGIQPWNFLVVNNQQLIRKIADTTRKYANRYTPGLEKLLIMTASVIKNTQALILIYSDGRVQKRIQAYHMHPEVQNQGQIAEMLTIGAAVQNMYLVANELGLGAVWLDAPTFFYEKINKIVHEKHKLIILLALGYARKKSKRSNRKPYSEMVRKI